MTDLDLTTLTLAEGAHEDRTEGVCLMEAVAWWRGLDHTDHPPCVSPRLGEFGRSLNDVLPDDKRQQLVPFIPVLPGTADDGLDQARGLMAADWLIRVYLPAWLDLAGISHRLREQSPLTSWSAVEGITPALRVLKEQAAAAGDAARDAAGAAARAAAGAAAWDAAGDAAGAAAWDAAWDAAGDAAGAAAWAAARDAARAAARDAAGAAARDAARDAAGEKLAPTVAQLQDSAIALYADMIRGSHGQ
jgi:hypothetical protein